MMLAGTLSLADPRAPLMLLIGYPLLLGAATLMECYAAYAIAKIMRRKAATSLA